MIRTLNLLRLTKEHKFLLLINFFYYTQQLLTYVLRFTLSIFAIKAVGNYIHRLCNSQSDIISSQLIKSFNLDVFRYSSRVSIVALFLLVISLLLKLGSLNVPGISFLKMAFRDSTIVCLAAFAIHQNTVSINSLLSGSTTRFQSFLALVIFLIIDYYLIQKILISKINQDILFINFDNSGNPRVVFKVNSTWEKYLRVERWNMQKEASFISSNILMDIFDMEDEGLIPIYQKNLYSDAIIKIKYCPVEIRARGKVVSDS